ncbi:hypothetical protein D018_2046A, partial [Vibrio parahaemolyticus VP2007-007]
MNTAPIGAIARAAIS